MPVAKIPTSNIFFRGGSFSFRMGNMGKMRIEMSDTTLNIPVHRKVALELRQWPVVIDLSHAFSIGLHWKILINTSVT